MILSYQQHLDPLQGTVLGSQVVSTVLAALPVAVLFWLLVPRRWLAPKAGAAGALTALAVAVLVYRMPFPMAGMAFLYGAAFGLLPVGWTIFTAMFIYNLTVETGQFAVVRRSVASLSGDARVQAVLIGFAFGAFLEGAAGAGTPVAICGAILVGLGFDPFLAAVLCLIANTSPVAYGGLGTPLIVLGGVTGLDTYTLSQMAGRQLPLLSFLVPLWMVRCLCGWRKTWAVWPVLLTAGGSFALFQVAFAHARTLYNLTDIGGGIFSLLVTAIFLRFWKPREEWHCSRPAEHPVASALGTEPSLTASRVILAWAPYLLMSILLLLSGVVRQREDVWKQDPAHLPSWAGIQTIYLWPIPYLDQQSFRDARLQEGSEPRAEAAVFQFAWLTSPGTPVLLAALLSIFLLRMSFAQVWRVFTLTVWQMRIPIPTIACMLGLSYITRYAGMDATLGMAFAGTGVLYPFFAPLLGWLGVFLTGTDAGSNALFGSLQKITANQVYHLTRLTSAQAQVLICTSNSTGGVMGKMIDAQSICVATAATHQVGKEADIFKAVVWHSITLAALVGLITLLQAYVVPFTRMVPK